MPKKRISILGSTGSIGTQSLQICEQYPDHYSVHSLAAGKNMTLLATQIHQFSPQRVSVADDATRQALLETLKQKGITPPAEILTTDKDGLESLASDSAVDDVLMGVVGMIGLSPSLSALKAGKRLLTANKETFVAGGHLVQPYLSHVIPFDSEHNALFQSLHHEPTKHIRTLWLTASGGPFRTWNEDQFESITKADALKHPNWVMGAKVTIDSATLMNKGLEVIEAHWLFGVPADHINVVVHPESIVHGLVEFVDGSILSQMGPADMRVPIQAAMSWPDRWDGQYMGTHINLLTLKQLNFEKPDTKRFPCLSLARQALETGPAATCVLNAADEMAVQAFLNEQISFTEIPLLIMRVLDTFSKKDLPSIPPDLESVLNLDTWSRKEAFNNIERLFH